MEALKYLTLIFLFSLSASANEEIMYVTDSFSHFYEFKSVDSPYLQTLSCGTPVKVVEKNIAWAQVRFHKQSGFVSSAALSSMAPSCFHEKYPKFYEALQIDSADLYYWGKLGGRL